MNTNTNTTEKVINIVAGLSAPVRDVTPECNLTNDLGLDSLDVAELLMECEKRFKIRINATSEDVRTVQDLINLVEKAM